MLKGTVMWRGGLSSAPLGKKYPSLSVVPKRKLTGSKAQLGFFPQALFLLPQEMGELTKGKDWTSRYRYAVSL